MDDLNRRKAMKLAAASGVALGGVLTSAALNAHAQDQEGTDLSESENDNAPPEADDSTELSSADAANLSLAFPGELVVFLLKGVDATVIQNRPKDVIASTIRKSVRQNARFIYVIVSRSLRFAIAKKAGLLMRHQVWIKIQAGKWRPLEKSPAKPLVGNTP
jgi:hypothetical protein